MTDTFQPGDHVTFELDQHAAAKLNDNCIHKLSLNMDQIRVHTRPPGEATLQKQEMIEFLDKIIMQSNDNDEYVEYLKEIRDFIVRADLPGEGMKNTYEIEEEILSCIHKIITTPTSMERTYDTYKLKQIILRIQADARRGGPEPSSLRDALIECRTALLWCSGSPDFNENGQAREGWLTIAKPAIQKADAVLPKPAEIK